MARDSVKLFGFWASPFPMRAYWTLKLKGVEYEYIEENIPAKGPLLLQYNRVLKRIPVLVPNGEPLLDLFVRMEYIDETWKQNTILPEDPYERALACFWAKLVDDKCVPTIIRAYTKKGEEKEKVAKEARENLKILKSGLGENASLE